MHADINNHFRSQEIAGLEVTEDQYIYIQVVHLKPPEDPKHFVRNSQQTEEESQQKCEQIDEVNVHESEQKDDQKYRDQKDDANDQNYCDIDQKHYENDQSADENDQGDDRVELDEYLIWVSDDEETEVVSVLDLFKILSIKQVTLNDDSADLVLYLTEGENVKVWNTLKDDTLKEMIKAICSELHRRWNIINQEQKRKAIKSLYLKWHPDKNPHLIASQAFQFLQHQIKRLEQGLPLEDQEDDWVEQTNSPPEAPYWEECFRMWNDIADDHGNTWRNEKSEVRTQTEEGVAIVDLDPVVRFQVNPQPTIAKVWLKQAEYDLKALHVLLNNAGDDIVDKVSAHVCFLACQLQVAEKSLKAGMYHMFGLRERSHNFVRYAQALEQKKGTASPRTFGTVQQFSILLFQYEVSRLLHASYSPL